MKLQKKSHKESRRQRTYRPSLELLEDRTLLSATLDFPLGFGSPAADFVHSTAIDGDGNSYVIGTYSGAIDLAPDIPGNELGTPNGSSDSFIASHDAQGQFRWAVQINDPATPGGGDMAVDAAGNVYVTGAFVRADFDGDGAHELQSFRDQFGSGTDDVLVAKFDNNGNLLWARSMGGTGHERGNSIAVDALGNVYVTGEFTSNDFDPDPANGSTADRLDFASSSSTFVAKLNSDGNLQWAKGIGGTVNDVVFGEGIAVNGLGEVHVTGDFAGTIDFDPSAATTELTSADINAFVQKLDTNGNFVWADMVTAGALFSQGSDIAVEGAGDVYLTGFFQGTADFDPGPGTFSLVAPNGAAFVAKRTAAGGLVWAAAFAGSGGSIGNAIAVSSSGVVYSTGRYFGTVDFDPANGNSRVFNLTSAGSGDVYLAMLDSDGAFVYAKGMGGTGNEEGRGVAIDAAGRALVVGHFAGVSDFHQGNLTRGDTLTSAGGNDGFLARLAISPPLAGDDTAATAAGVAITIDVLSNDADPGFQAALHHPATKTVAGNLDTTRELFQINGVSFYPYVNADAHAEPGSIDGAAGFQSLAGVGPNELTFTVNDLELINVVKQPDIVTIEYGDDDNSPAVFELRRNGQLIGFGDDLLSRIHIDVDPDSPTFTLATGTGSVTLRLVEEITDRSFYDEVLALTGGTGVLRFETDSFVVVEPGDDPAVSLSSGRITLDAAHPAVSLSVERVEINNAFGEAVINPDQTITYIPAPGFVGEAVFTYYVRDQAGATAAATVTVEVRNTPPMVGLGGSVTIQEGDTLSATGSFTDPDDDNWIATVDYGDGSGAQTLALNADKTFQLNHTYTDADVYTVTVTIADGQNSAGGSFVVTVENVVPSVSAGADLSAAVGDTVTFSASFTDPARTSITSDTDPVSDVVTLSWQVVDESDNVVLSTERTLQIEVVAGLAFYSGIDENGNFITSDRITELEFTPAEEGVYTATISVTDDDGALGADSLTITVGDEVNDPSNRAPSVLDVTLVGIKEDRQDAAPRTNTFSGSDPDSDDDGSTLIYTITSQPSEGRVSNPNDSRIYRFDTNGDFQDLGEGELREVSFNFTATDRHGAVSEPGTITVRVTGVNDAPVLTGDGVLTPLTEDDVDNFGDIVGDIIAGTVSDVDNLSQSGIALINIHSGDGAWQYSIDNGINWQQVGAVHEDAALLLEADDLLRFVPQGYAGDLAFIDYRAWDQTSGTAGERAGASTNGGMTAFSSSTASAYIQVSELNDAPVLNTSGIFTLSPVAANEIANNGNKVSELLQSGGGNPVSDSDRGAEAGIAVTYADDSMGVWQYSLDDGANWSGIGAAGSSQARLLGKSDRIRFVPDGSSTGESIIRFRAWDLSERSAGNTANTFSNGGSSPYSNGIATAEIVIWPAVENGEGSTFTIGNRTMVNSDDPLSVDLPPLGGEYTVHSAGSLAYFLDQELNLALHENGDYHNWGGQNERWVIGSENVFGNRWYYILPTGEFYAWAGQPGQTLGGKLAQIEPVYYHYLEMLTDASPEHLAHVLMDGLQLYLFGDNEYEDFGGQGDKWLGGVNNMFGSAWYYILPNGAFYAWDRTPGTASGELLAKLDMIYHEEFDRLYDAQPNQIEVVLDQAEHKLTLDPGNDFVGHAWVKLSYQNGVSVEETFKLTVQPSNEAPVINEIPDQIMPAGQDGLTIGLTVTDADGDDIESSVEAFGLYVDGNDWHNWAGRNEKWVRGTNGMWHFILENGELYRWDGTSGRASGMLLRTFDRSYWEDLSRLTGSQEEAYDVSLDGTDLTIDPADEFLGSFWVLISASDKRSASYSLIGVTVKEEVSP